MVAHARRVHAGSRGATCWRGVFTGAPGLVFRSNASFRSPVRFTLTRNSSLSDVNTTARFRPREIATYHWLRLVAPGFAASANSTVSTVLPWAADDVTASPRLNSR